MSRIGAVMHVTSPGCQAGEIFAANESLDPKVEGGGFAKRCDDPYKDADPTRRIALSQLHQRLIGSLISVDHGPFRFQSSDVVIGDLDGGESRPLW